MNNDMDSRIFYIRKYYNQGKIYTEYREKYNVKQLKGKKMTEAMQAAGIESKKTISVGLQTYQAIEKIRTIDEKLANDVLNGSTKTSSAVLSVASSRTPEFIADIVRNEYSLDQTNRALYSRSFKSRS